MSPEEMNLVSNINLVLRKDNAPVELIVETKFGSNIFVLKLKDSQYIDSGIINTSKKFITLVYCYADNLGVKIQFNNTNTRFWIL